MQPQPPLSTPALVFVRLFASYAIVVPVQVVRITGQEIGLSCAPRDEVWTVHVVYTAWRCLLLRLLRFGLRGSLLRGFFGIRILCRRRRYRPPLLRGRTPV